MSSKQTDIQKIKKQTVLIAHAVQVEPVPNIPCFAIHPFVNTPYWMERAVEEKMVNADAPQYDLTKPEVYAKWLQRFEEVVNSYDSVLRIYMLWNSPWKMTFMKFCGEYMNEKDFAEYLVQSWISQENPNMDCNVPVTEALKMFKKCKKEYLMDEEELRHYNELPETVEVWRGVAEGRVRLGLSWTDDKAKAEWFQHRFGDDNELLHLTVQKKDIVAYLNRRNEQEIVLDVMKYKSELVEKRKTKHSKNTKQIVKK